MHIEKPFDFMDTSLPNQVCKITKSFYRLKQTLRAWFHMMFTTLINLNFISSKLGRSMFISSFSTKMKN